VQEIDFAVFPKEAGDLLIQPPIVKALDMSEALPRGRSRTFMGSRGEVVQFSGQPITVKVKPIPAAFEHQWWLPARDVSVTETWSTTPDQFHVGDAITRTITLTAKGAMADQIPEVSVAPNESISVYPDQAVVESVVEEKMVVGRRTQKFAIVPNKDGELVLPAVTVRWWNVETSKAEMATLPAKTIKVLPPLPGTVAVPVAPPLNSPLPALAPSALEKVLPAVIVDQPHRWFYVSMLFLGAWLVTLLLWLVTAWRNKRVQSQPAREKAETEKTLRRHLVTDIKKACESKNAQATKTALLAWSPVYWPKKKPAALGHIAELLGNDDFAVHVEKLNAVLYKGGDDDWDGKAFWKAFEACFSRSKKKKEDGEVLPPLY
jgi:hypothetical protein